ncbi:MAG: protein-export chaperone SecB [Pseudomonadota bacterium]
MTTSSSDADQRSFRVVTQAVQDFSFENPGFANTSRKESDEVPEIAVNVNLRTGKMSENDDLFMASVTIKAKSTHAENPLFVLELTYNGVFEISGFEEEIRNQILNIQAPNMLFPFMRQIIANMTTSGSYPPLYIDPIDFAGLYFQKQEQARQNANGEAKESA